MMIVTIENGMATLPDGSVINLLAVQAVLNAAFQETGEQQFMHAGDDLAQMTLQHQGPNGEFEPWCPDEDVGPIKQALMDSADTLEAIAVHGEFNPQYLQELIVTNRRLAGDLPCATVAPVTYRARIVNGDFWSTDDEETIFASLAEVIAEAEEFLEDATGAGLEYSTSDIEVVTSEGAVLQWEEIVAQVAK